MGKIRKLIAMMMAAALMMTAGCDKEDGNIKLDDKSKVDVTDQINSDEKNNDKEKKQDEKLPPELPQKSKDKKEQEKEMKIKVYYPDESGIRLIGVDREVESGNDKYEAAVKAVMTPPVEKNLTKIVNNDKSLISVKVDNGEAIVNLNSNIKTGFSGGSTGEEFLIGSIVNTLTEFKEVQSVKFLVDGKTVETLSGHMDLSEPIKRMDNLLKNN